MSGPDNFYGSTSGMAGGSFDGGDTSNMDNGPRANLIVNYLPQTMTEKDLYSLFAPFGLLESCRVMRDYKSGYSYGFGFVKYHREEDALAAIGGRDGFAIQNKRLKVSFARPSSDAIKGTNLYVSNLPHEITDYQLEVIFGKYGRIVQKNILRDKMGICRGVAFVRFDRREEAQEAISALNNVIPEGGKKPLSVKVAEEHGKLKAALFTGWNSNMNQNRGDQFFGNLGFCSCSLPRNDCVHQRNFHLMTGCNSNYVCPDRRFYDTKRSHPIGDWGFGNPGVHPASHDHPYGGDYEQPYDYNVSNNGQSRNFNSKSRPGNRNGVPLNINDKYNKKNQYPYSRNNFKNT
ncbi:sex-lethal homolog [Arctopsyche grandis]|uniref:sex-lethal homolog n=1 Tax=Arctopsyche grandis TaxID=121162 RepID=UPI00406DA08A